MHLKTEGMTHTLCWIDGRLVAYQSDLPGFMACFAELKPQSAFASDYIDTPSAILNEGFVSIEQWQQI